MSAILSAGAGIAIGAMPAAPVQAAPAGTQAPNPATDEFDSSYFTKPECVRSGRLGKDNSDWVAFRCKRSVDENGNEIWSLYVTTEEPAAKPEPRPGREPQEQPREEPRKPGKNPLMGNTCDWVYIPALCDAGS
ncbi:hypothetical protein [Actinoplanes sp. NPDC051851]|uniref:hypothetical protein n=1 Tax=Actinoplanes sp. NPDC051851 TaxID=3154753 RepID=UPI00341C5DEE